MNFPLHSSATTLRRSPRHPNVVTASHAHRRQSRAAYSLVEMLVVMALLSTLFAVTGTTLHRLLRWDRTMSLDTLRQRQREELQWALRRDVRTASDIQLTADGSTLQIQLSGSKTVSYAIDRSAIDKSIIRRIVIDTTVLPGTPPQREQFTFPRCELTWVLDQHPQSDSANQPPVVLQARPGPGWGEGAISRKSLHWELKFRRVSPSNLSPRLEAT